MFKQTFIIAEAGVNHNGDLKIAKKMIDAASETGVDAIKFQTFKTENLVCKDAKKAQYQKNNTNNKENQFEMLKRLEFSYEDFKELKEYCKLKNIMFLSSPFDLESIDMLKKLDIEIFKVPSGEIENVAYLREIAKCNKKIILSSGMCNLSDIEFALDILEKEGAKDISILHCNTEYPTPMEDVNLKAMETIKKAFSYDVGYSDHTKGIEIPIAAVALGAKIIEKHFTLDKSMDGPDHAASLTPKELKSMVSAIRNIEKALGNGRKTPSKSEAKNKEIARKSVVSKRPIKKGEVFTLENITTKRPGTGISPKRFDEIIGKVAIKDFNEDEMIKLC
ncbi:N-acetylneuraminate synthase [Clostridium chrysemydis]|uniref:N-acetylneuraminate synthase n=1 Tax=Clostridium chrysemydis TaxID=2665504 RepID=UPI001883921D|nr:N-acetylneuraminate synthase [Clostridium chrysemydis]